MNKVEMHDACVRELHKGFLGGFMEAQCEAYLKADGGNQELLLPVMNTLWKKYELEGAQ